MRILLVAPPWLPVPPPAYGGTEWVVSGLADGLVGAGHEVTLVASDGSRSRADLISAFDTPQFEMMGDTCTETVQALTAYRLADRFDLIHDHSGVVGPALASLSVRSPVVHTLHNPWSDVRGRIARLVSPPVHLIAISHDQARRAPAGVWISAVIHNGLAVERFPFRSAKEDFLLFVGRACKEKGPETAIEVARRTGRRLVIAMKVNQPDERAYFENVLQPLMTSSADIDYVPNPDHVHKADLMGRAAAVVVPIEWPEPFGLVMAEANACGTPVVAFDVGAASEVVAHGVTGFVIAPGSIEEFCEGVSATDRIRPEDCRHHVERCFSTARMVKDHMGLYDRLTAGHAETSPGEEAP